MGRVGDQFLTTFNRLWNVQGLGSYVEELWTQYCDLTLMVTVCRSAGMWRKRNIVYYGYGTPRCGDQEFAARMDESSYHRYRINWLADNIPYVINYKSWLLGGVINEVETCDFPEDYTCNTGTASSQHTSYFSTSQGNYDGLTCGLFTTFTVA
ncbi:unnamed protein product [Strongylus vulgaris]|uniref:Fungal lipase-type domain-containing protein n=1 Tax=Strongylus vulgaris TaxID=40348 RepID=A0A3P7JS57_STRVU|nr:unnamed protein product [Strongylus vulgaris]